MYRRFLIRMQAKVRLRQYVMTLHANEEMEQDGLTIFDVERGILTGEILEHQRDRQSGESKFRMKGQTLRGEDVEVIAKIGHTGNLVIIMVYMPLETEE